ncbi:hypothetical protein MTR_3g069310 [Medicago truncatula]|uniref:Uncharacterized protein n=1 Tax=Medicago truncatula TaxID=3880 RepID=G7JA10_MEDTR|nr:hypothetical protein MTR_3g069310 [Medicago truncatula]
MLNSLSKSTTRCNIFASYVGHLMLQRSLKVDFVYLSSPTFFVINSIDLQICLLDTTQICRAF